jgi:molecular chaperone DnaK
MSGWGLGIDFGTSYTVGSVSHNGTATVIDVESSGRARIPSAVFLAQDDTILVGTAAQHQAVFAPERYEPTPKRSIGEGELFLGDRLVTITDLIAAVLRRVYTEACRQQGERMPDGVVITHPADWAESRLATLREAVQKGGLPDVTFLPEPVAAAARIALASTSPGQRIAVYDFGGGTFDAAVLRRTETGFVVAGPPAGRDPLGGEDIDDKIISHLGLILADEEPEAWASLRTPPDVNWRRDAAAFRGEVQRAKETLSETTVCQLWVPGIGREIQITRAELDELIAPVVEDTVTTLETAIRGADLQPGDLGGIYLVGGSSRIPSVAEAIWHRLGVRPSVQDNPKSVVALGAAGYLASLRPAPAPPGVAPATVTPTLPDGIAAIPAPEAATTELIPITTLLAMSFELRAWPSGSECAAHLTLDRPGPAPLTIRARDEATPVATAEDLARLVLPGRQARTPGFRETWCGPAWVLRLSGYERRFVMRTATGDVPMCEQYLVTDGRAVVIAAPEAARSTIEALTYEARRLPPDGWFESRFGGMVTADWVVDEQLVLQRRVSRHLVYSSRRSRAGGIDLDAWRTDLLGRTMSHPDASVLSEAPGRVFNQLEGRIWTVGYTEAGSYMLSKLGGTLLGGHGLAVTIALPHAEQALFPALASHAWLHPNVGASG